MPATGKNLTDMTVDTLATGADNGVEVPYVHGSHLLLRNDMGGSAAAGGPTGDRAGAA